MGFLRRHAQPVGVVLPRQAGETPQRVERQVDGVEFDVGQRVHQHGAPFHRHHRAPAHETRQHQLGALRAAGDAVRRGHGGQVGVHVERAGAIRMGGRHRGHGGHLGLRIALQQATQRPRA